MTRPLILVCGEALIDLFVEGPAPGPRAELAARAVAGGSPFNVAVGLARLGARSAYLGGVSMDGFGAFLLDRLRAEGVDASLVQRSPAPTPLAIVSAGAEGQPDYAFRAADCADRDLSADAFPPELPAETAALAFGSYAIAVEPAGSALLALAEREAGRRVISLDPNLRPALAGPLDAWRERIARFGRCASIVKLSLEDLRAGWGADADPDACAAGWLAGGAELVVLTRGPDGATGYRAGGRIDVPGRAVDVVDTVGAGDTFHAALLSGLARSERLGPGGAAAMDDAALAALLRRAVLASSITCTRRGADMPSAADLLAEGG